MSGYLYPTGGVQCGAQWAILQFFCDHISYMLKTCLQYLLQVHSVPNGLYKKIMYGFSHYAVRVTAFEPTALLAERVQNISI